MNLHAYIIIGCLATLCIITIICCVVSIRKKPASGAKITGAGAHDFSDFKTDALGKVEDTIDHGQNDDFPALPKTPTKDTDAKRDMTDDV